ncbi:MAG: DUF2975 domain-containing protein [Pseudoxanthomonas sp.]
MTPDSTPALALARPAIKGLTVLNILYALAIAALLVWSFFIDGWPQRPLGFDMTNAHPWVGQGLRAIVVVGLLAAAVVHTILKRLLAIVDTVRVGDPFILDNARRLEAIAWRVMALEGLRLVVATIAAVVWEKGRIEAFSFAPWLAVLLLFVLAGVFAHGARMRADLEGTV